MRSAGQDALLYLMDALNAFPVVFSGLGVTCNINRALRITLKAESRTWNGCAGKE